MKKIAIVAGGTGGHIYPALTLADELKKKGYVIDFIGSDSRMEKRIVPERGYKFIGLDVLSTQGGIISKVKSLLSITKNYFKSKKILKDYDMAIGFGNYISVPVILAAKSLGLKTVLHEQNSFAGKANKFLDKYADLVIGSYSENKSQFKNKNTKVLGNPQASVALKTSPSDYLEKLGLDKKKKTVVIFMGSLGSESVNEVIIDFLNQHNSDYQIIYATGSAYYDKTVKEVKTDPMIKVFERIDGIKAMCESTLLLCRAGATTLTEITAIGMPSIIVPSPYVPNNHQFHNAKALVDKQAALMIEEKELNVQKLKATIDSIINDEKVLMELSKNARSLSNDNVLEDIIKEIEAL